jgi:hypothetical protein
MKLKRLYLSLQPNWQTSVLIYASVIILIAACATVPITGRSQLILISDDQIGHTPEAPANTFITAAPQKHAIVTESDSPGAARAIGVVTNVVPKAVAY